MYRVTTCVPFTGSITSVRRQSVDTRENSIGKMGPPFCHVPSLGRSRGSQISDPQPNMTIFKGSTLSSFVCRADAADSTSPISIEPSSRCLAALRRTYEREGFAAIAARTCSMNSRVALYPTVTLTMESGGIAKRRTSRPFGSLPKLSAALLKFRMILHSFSYSHFVSLV